VPASSSAQQRFMALVHNFQLGKVKKEDVDAKVEDAASSMTKSESHDFMIKKKGKISAESVTDPELRKKLARELLIKEGIKKTAASLPPGTLLLTGVPGAGKTTKAHEISTGGQLQEPVKPLTSLIPESGVKVHQLNQKSYPDPETQQLSIDKAAQYRLGTAKNRTWRWLQNLQRLRLDRTPVTIVRGKEADIKLKPVDSMGMSANAQVLESGKSVTTPGYAPVLYVGGTGEVRSVNDPARFKSELGHESVHFSQYPNLGYVSGLVPDSVQDSVKQTNASANPDPELEAAMQEFKTRIYRNGKDPYGISGEEELKRLLHPSQPRGYLQRLTQEQVDKNMPLFLHIMRGVAGTGKPDPNKAYA
jgi:hypothetical protein